MSKLELIARFWSARTTVELSGEYCNYFGAKVLPELRAVPGFVSAQLLTRSLDSGNVEILVITSWNSLESIKGFAGTDMEAAVVHPAAAALLTDYDRHVHHFNVALSESS